MNGRRRGTREESLKHQIQSEYADEQADVGRDCRTRLARPKISGADADREISIFPVQLTTCRIGYLTRLIHTLAICVTIHTYFQHAHFIPIVGVGKERRTLIGPW